LTSNTHWFKQVNTGSYQPLVYKSENWLLSSLVYKSENWHLSPIGLQKRKRACITHWFTKAKTGI